MAMRLRSRTGCATCRRRRKKCDERKPTCSACTRLKLRCWYDQTPAAHGTSTNRGVTLLGHLEIVANPDLYKNPQLWTYRNIPEQTALQRAPFSIAAFYGPLSCKEVRDLRLIWQMMYHDELLYNATTACFSVVLGTTPRHGQLCRLSYCLALQQARERLTSRILHRNDLVVLQTAVLFLGLMDSVGPEQSSDSDLLLHWRGLAHLLKYSFENRRTDWSPLQKNVFIMVLEATMYPLACHMLFVKDAKAIWKLWRETRMLEMLEETNPPGPQRIANSPFMGGAGDYIVYDLVVQLTYLSRIPNVEGSSGPMLDDIESTLRHLKLALKSRLAQKGAPTYPALAVYVMYLGAVSIQLAALRKPSPAQNKIIDDKASEVLEELSKTSSAEMNQAPATWPVQILACAIRLDSNFARFKKELAVFKARLDPGHTRRLEAIVERVERIRLVSKRVPSQNSITTLPALALLRKPDGILS